MSEGFDIGLIRSPIDWSRWQEAKALLAPALDLSDSTWEDVEDELAGGKADLGVVTKGGDQGDLLAAMVLRTIDAKAGPMIEMFLIAGREYHLWTAQLSEMLATGARAAGCVGLRAWGRPGWLPILKSVGWKAPVIGFEMDLTT